MRWTLVGRRDGWADRGSDGDKDGDHMIAFMTNRFTGESEIFASDLLKDQVALVTGGGTGLGKATAHELVRCGATVVIAGRRGEVLQSAAGEIGAGADWIVGDVRERADAERLVATVLERHGKFDLLVNNAGGQYFTPAEGIAAKGWRAVWRLNVEGTLNMAEAAFARAMEPAGRGTIVNVTLSPHHGMPGMAHSGAARAAVEELTRELARRGAGVGVAVTAVAAGHFDTEALEKYPASLRAGMARTVPLQRLGTVEEHAWLVALLASPLGRAFSGSTVTLDGARDNWFGPWPPPGLADESGEVPTEERKGSQSSE
jgi:citronellol/citronellal dehydrogenase